MAEGRLFAVVGPSGAGKDTLLDALRDRRSDLRMVRRAITRPEAAGGEDFEGVSVAEFERRREAGDFALWWGAHGLFYGIPKDVEDWLAAGEDVMFNGSRGVLAEAGARFPELHVLHVTASAPVLAERLATRGRESAEDIEARLRRADYALPEGLTVSVIRNDGALEDAVAAMLDAVQPVSA